MKKQKFTPLTDDQIAYANKAICRFLADLEEHGVHIVYDCCDGGALFVPADFVNTYAEDGCVAFGKDIIKKINATDTPIAQPWNGWLTDEETDPDTHEDTRWSIDVNTEWKEPEKTETEDQAGKKYKLTDDTIVVDGHTLHRIRALRDITDPDIPGWSIPKGELGGYVESEKNLSHEGAAWVGDNAKVYENAIVMGNALLYEEARVYGSAKVYGNAHISDEAYVYDDAEVFGSALVYGYSYVYGNAKVFDHACVTDQARVYGDAQIYEGAEVRGESKVYDMAKVFGDAEVNGEAKIFDNAVVCGNASIYDYGMVYGNAKVCGEVKVFGEAEVCKDTEISSTEQDDGDSTETPDLETRLATLEARVETLAKDTEKNTRDMAQAIKDIKDIQKQLAKKKSKKRS